MSFNTYLNEIRRFYVGSEKRNELFERLMRRFCG